MVILLALVLLYISSESNVFCQSRTSSVNTRNRYREDCLEKCHPQRCECKKWQLKSILNRYYGGIFFKERELKRKERQWREMHATNYRMGHNSSWYGSDYDYCCPTSMSHKNDSYMTNMKGEMKAIWHMTFLSPARYQWIPHAECVGLIGSCPGECEIEMIMVDLLVYKFGGSWPFEFDTFQVPGYCSCKSSS